ncbi:MAG: aldo/keto reductase [Paracoccaceae bacterium]
MRRIHFGALGEPVSQIGMGCASLGSRISPRRGLEALERAFDAGISWYDVAPAYGAGAAEGLVGRFAQKRRDRIQICTKVGLAPPARNNTLRLVYAVARPAAAMTKGLRSGFRKSGLTRNRHLDLTPGLVLASLEQSLRRLGTDHVDVYALHDPIPDDTRREDIVAALEDIRDRGLARAISIAGSVEACCEGLRAPSPFRIAQLADPPHSGAISRVLAATHQRLSFVTHSVLGVNGPADLLASRLRTDAGLSRLLSDHGFANSPADVAASLLTRRALMVNPDGVVLLSMFSHRHLAACLEAASAPALPHQILCAIDSASTARRLENTA